MRRRRFLSGLGAAAAGTVLARLEWAVASDLPPLTLAFYTDVHAMPGLTDVSVLTRAAALLTAEDADGIFCGGDVIHRGHVSTVEDCRPRFALYREFLAKLPKGVVHVPGNHDLAGAKPEDGQASADPWALWREELAIGEPCRSVDAAGYRFLVLDTLSVTGEGPFPYKAEAGADRLAWLDRELAATPPGHPLILCTHIPLRSDFVLSKHGPTPPASLLAVDAPAIFKRFEGRNLAAVLQGHLHLMEEMRVGDVPVLTCGALSGSWWSTTGNPKGYARIRISGGLLRWEFVKVG
jgi:3',5'-cyclic AMP phosphodiesterase CpdA